MACVGETAVPSMARQLVDDHDVAGGRDVEEAARDAQLCTNQQAPTAMKPAPLSDDAAAFLRRSVQQSSAMASTKNTTDTELLVHENELLRNQIADLTGALKARDMEITALRERCQSLLRAIDQQDETIAKIYAVASPTPSSNSLTTAATTTMEPPVPAAAKTRRATTSTVPRSTKPLSSSPPLATKPATEKMVPNSVGNLISDAIERILNPSSSLFSPPSTSATATTSSGSSHCPPRRRMSLFDDDTTTDSSPSSCSSTLSKSSSTRSFDRRESSASDEDFVKSAGFLRKPSRRASGRLSISDFGLLDDDDTSGGVAEDDRVDGVDNQRDEETNGTLEKRAMLNGTTSGDLQQKRSRSASSMSSGSKRNLFADIDEASSTKPWTNSSSSSSNATSRSTTNNQEETADGEEREMTYAEFLERLRLPASRDLLETIRMFLASVLGPRGDGKPPRSTDFVDYDFYGTHELRRRCTYFFQSTAELLLNHPLWCHTSESTVAKARDGVEKYVMDKLHDLTMNQLDECAHWRDEDERLLTRMKLLSPLVLIQFVTPDMLDIKPCMRNEVVWSMAEDELRRINSFRSPGDKINCIVRCCSIIFSVLNLTRGDSGSRPGADDFLPVFIYIVLHSKIPRLYSNCEYIAAYRNPNDLMSKAGYCFVNLRSALEFLSVVDGSMLSIDGDEFTRLYNEQERKLQ